jgi:predicted Zn-dependent protease
MRSLKVLLFVVIIAGCATNPATGRRQLMLMSESQEIQIGRQSDAEVRKQMGVYNDPELQQLVSRVGQRLAQAAHRPNLPWTFTVVDEPAVNAFALPGGFIYITRGILPFLRDEAELAAVMGHEVGHVDARHSAEQYSKQQLAGGGLLVASVLAPEYGNLIGAGGGLAAQAILLKYGRDAELESDRLGVGYSAANGWEPRAMEGLLNTLARLDEAQGSRRGVPTGRSRTAGRRSRDEDSGNDRHRADAGVAGDQSRGLRARARRPGVRRQPGKRHRARQRFPASDPPLRVAVPERVASRQQRRAGGGGRTRRRQRRHGARVRAECRIGRTDGVCDDDEGGVEGGERRADAHRGLDEYVGTYEGAAGNTRIGVLAAHIRSGNQTYLVAGLSPVSEFSRVRNQFNESIHSFRPLSDQEAERIQPNRVDFQVVRPGDTWDSLARQAGSNVKGSTLAIMNGQDPASRPRAGDESAS